MKLTGGAEPQSLDLLAAMYAEEKRFAEAAATARRALDLAVRMNIGPMAEALRTRIARYESQVRTP